MNGVLWLYSRLTERTWKAICSHGFFKAWFNLTFSERKVTALETFLTELLNIEYQLARSCLGKNIDNLDETFSIGQWIVFYFRIQHGDGALDLRKILQSLKNAHISPEMRAQAVCLLRREGPACMTNHINGFCRHTTDLNTFIQLPKMDRQTDTRTGRQAVVQDMNDCFTKESRTNSSSSCRHTASFLGKGHHKLPFFHFALLLSILLYPFFLTDLLVVSIGDQNKLFAIWIVVVTKWQERNHCGSKTRRV